MPKFLITPIQKLIYEDFVIEAETPEEAEEKAEKMYDNDELDLNDYEMDHEFDITEL